MGRIITQPRVPSVHYRLTGEQVLCPKCHRRQIYFRKKADAWYCRLCNIQFKEPAKMTVTGGEHT